MTTVYENMFVNHDRERERRLRNGEYLAEILCSYVTPKRVAEAT